MSKKGTSTRERKIDTIIDHIRDPAYLMRETNRWGVQCYIVEKKMARIRAPYLGETTSITEVIDHERFDDEKLAMFARDRKNAEALMESIERIGSDKRRQS